MSVDKKVISYYASFYEVSKDLNQKQFYDFNMAIYSVMFFDKHIDKVVFEDKILSLLWKSIKHSIDSSIKGFCGKKDIPYDDIFKGVAKGVDNEVSNNEKENEKGKENENDNEKDKDNKQDVAIIEIDEISETPLSHRAIKYLNKLTKKNYGFGKGNTKEIEAQIKKGATEDNLKYVIDVKYSEWANNQDMKKHLNPTTLFREANYDKYLNQEMSLTGIVMDNYIDQRCGK